MIPSSVFIFLSMVEIIITSITFRLLGFMRIFCRLKKAVGLKFQRKVFSKFYLI